MAADSSTKTPRVTLGGREAKTENAKGRVRVYLTLVDSKNKAIQKNVSAVLYVNGATVTEVSNQIQKALA